MNVSVSSGVRGNTASAASTPTSARDVMGLTMPMYYVDERVGCIAVRLRFDGDVSPGCHPDLPDVVAWWGGCEVRDWQREKAQLLCATLNGSQACRCDGEKSTCQNDASTGNHHAVAEERL